MVVLFSPKWRLFVGMMLIGGGGDATNPRTLFLWWRRPCEVASRAPTPIGNTGFIFMVVKPLAWHRNFEMTFKRLPVATLTDDDQPCGKQPFIQDVAEGPVLWPLDSQNLNIDKCQLKLKELGIESFSIRAPLVWLCSDATGGRYLCNF